MGYNKQTDCCSIVHFIQIIKNERSLPMSFMNCQMQNRKGAVRVTISSYESSSSGLRLVFIEFLQTKGQSYHARHAYIYPAERERDKREKRRCNHVKGDSSTGTYEHNEDGTHRLHYDGWCGDGDDSESYKQLTQRWRDTDLVVQAEASQSGQPLLHKWYSLELRGVHAKLRLLFQD